MEKIRRDTIGKIRIEEKEREGQKRRNRKEKEMRAEERRENKDRRGRIERRQGEEKTGEERKWGSTIGEEGGTERKWGQKMRGDEDTRGEGWNKDRIGRRKREETTQDERQWEKRNQDDIFPSYLHIFIFPFCHLYQPSFPISSPFIYVSYISTCLLPLLLPLSSPPTLSPSLSLHSSTSFLCPSLPVSPVYEGKFIGLPGAVSWRWPPLLKPQQGFTLHMEQKRHSGHTGLFPSPHITHDDTLTPPIIY